MDYTIYYFGDTFKSGATFIGCEATSKKLSPLKSISLTTGRYFLADPDSFDKEIAQGEIGIIPDWLKTEVNPHSLQPDPARTLLKYFPELRSDSPALTHGESPLSEPPDEFLNQARAWLDETWVIPDAPPPTGNYPCLTPKKNAIKFLKSINIKVYLLFQGIVFVYLLVLMILK